MNPERLLEHYHRIADAEDAVPRLRRFVLDLAVRGKLVEQDPADEPAAELLKRLIKNKSRLIASGEIKPERKGKNSSLPIDRFELPNGWIWTNLQAVSISITDGDHLPPPKADTGVPFLVISDVRTKTINYSPQRYVPRSYYDSLDSIRRPKRGDLLYTLVGSFGIPVEVLDDCEFCIQRHIGIIRPAQKIHIPFLARFMESQFIFNQADACATGIAQRTIPLSGLRAFMIPLPPLAEQHRIVAKVDELMALCDQLEAARSERETTRERLTAAGLARLTAPGTEQEDFPAHARFALGALPALTARPGQIKVLRQAILNLAVRGKLVEQNPADEPAAELLKRIAVEKARLVTAGEFREPRNAAEINRNALPFAVPAHWVWSRLIEIARPSYGFAFKSSQFNSEKRGMPLIRIRDISRTDTEAYYEGDYDPAYLVHLGDYLVGMDGNFNLRCWQGPDGLLNQRVMRINSWRCEIDPGFVRLPLQIVLDHLHGDTSLMTVKHLSAKQVNGIEIPLPPLAEQHRIVTTVDKLMVLCDKLEAALSNADATQARLLNSFLHEALAAGGKRERGCMIDINCHNVARA